MADQTTTDTLAEIEGQSEPQPVQIREGRWRTRGGDIRHVTPTPSVDSMADIFPWHDAAGRRHRQLWRDDGKFINGVQEHGDDLVEYLGPIEPEPEQTITPDDATGLVGRQLIRDLVLQVAEAIEATEQPEPEQQPVQVCEGRWRTRGGKIRHVTPTPAHYREADRHSWHDAYYYQTWYPSGQYSLTGDHPLDLVQYLGPIESEPEPQPEPQPEQQPQPEPQPVQVREGRWRTRGGEVKNIKPCEPFRSAYYVWPWTDGYMTFQDNGFHMGSNQSVNDLVQYLGPIESEPEPQPEPQPVHMQAMIEAQTETIARLNSEIHSLNMEIGGLQAQLEAVKAELVQVSKDRQALQIELDAREQVPQAVSDRFEEGWDAGTARAVETIAEWTEPFRTCGSQGLSYHVMQNLPHIMRSLTGLTDED